MRYWHVRISSVRRLNLFPTEAARRQAARCIARVCGPSLVQFSVADDHCHADLVCDADQLPHLRSALMRALEPIAGSELAPSYVIEVQTRSHLRANVDYFLTQAWHHGLDFDPALDAGCCFQDLVGARKLPGFAPHLLKRALPRLQIGDLMAAVKLPQHRLVPATPDQLRTFGAHRIAQAASAALAADPTLHGRSDDVILARRASVHLIDLAGIARREAVAALRLTTRAICRIAARAIDPAILDTVRRHLTLEELVHTVRGSRPRNWS